jgi:hypothetical protein
MTTGAAEHTLRHRGFARLPSARALLISQLVLSGLETLLAFAIILGVLLRPLAVAEKQA